VRITLVTEGTYPTAHGGVSVWCDQLIRGIPEHEFQVQAIVATGSEPALWPQPPNVTGTRLIPLWGPPPSFRAAVWHRRHGAPATEFDEALAGLLDAIFLPGPDDLAGFTAGLRRLRPFALRGDLTRRLRRTPVVYDMLRRWRRAPIPGRALRPTDRVALATVDDAVRATGLLEHFLRPLGFSAPPADLCHAVSNGLAGLVALGAAWDHGTPFLLTEHGIYLRERHLEYRQGQSSFAVRAFLVRFFALLTAASYQAADFIAPGSDYNGRWQTRQGAPADRIRRIHNGIDPAEFPPGPEPQAPTISWLGRITPIKDLEVLITAFRLVIDRIPQARLRLFGAPPAGDEEYRRACLRLVGALGLTGSVRFEGRVDSSVEAYHAGSVVVLSSRSEGFPYTVIEAMATGRATVSTDVGGVREAVGDTGLVVPPGDAQALATACIALLQDNRLRTRMALRARERAQRLFTLRRSLRSYRDLYLAAAAAGQSACQTKTGFATEPSSATSARNSPAASVTA
jgi:glycosyltransferase involved in cell wall biosynthesis